MAEAHAPRPASSAYAADASRGEAAWAAAVQELRSASAERARDVVAALLTDATCEAEGFADAVFQAVSEVVAQALKHAPAAP